MEVLFFLLFGRIKFSHFNLDNNHTDFTLYYRKDKYNNNINGKLNFFVIKFNVCILKTVRILN